MQESRKERRHEAVTNDIMAAAQRVLAREGGSSLNLRAIARELDMTPPALYRYFPSRDAILTALIIDSYDAVGSAVEHAASQTPLDHGGADAILAALHAFRRWAVTHPHLYGLLYGTPVPGYQAPESTIAPSTRTPSVLLSLLQHAIKVGAVHLPKTPLPTAVTSALQHTPTLKGGSDEILDPKVTVHALQFWCVLLGTVSGEIFGHNPLPTPELNHDLFDFIMRQALITMGADPDLVSAAGERHLVHRGDKRGP